MMVRRVNGFRFGALLTDVFALVVAGTFGLSPVESAFTATTSNVDSQFGAATSFSTGAMYRWGLDSAAAQPTTPSPLGSAVWSQLSKGLQLACGIRPDASLWCWGGNTFGQMGQGTADDRIL